VFFSIPFSCVASISTLCYWEVGMVFVHPS
jgi:hypothetical protein